MYGWSESKRGLWMTVVDDLDFGEDAPSCFRQQTALKDFNAEPFPFIGENSGDEAAGLSNTNASLRRDVKVRELKKDPPSTLLLKRNFYKSFEMRERMVNYQLFIKHEAQRISERAVCEVEHEATIGKPRSFIL